MSRHEPPEAVLRAWGSEPLPVDDPPRADERRHKIVAPLATAMREAGRRRERSRALRWAGSGFAAAAAIAIAAVGLATLGTQEASSPAPVVAAAGPTWTAARGAELVREGRSIGGTAIGGTASVALLPGDLVVTGPDGDGRATTASGASLDVAVGTALRVVAPDGPLERIEIARGGADVRVPALETPKSVHLGTPGVEISGAAAWFTVQVAEVTLGGARTTVEVRAGSVTIEYAGARVVLSTGESWTGPPPRAALPAQDTGTVPAKRDHGKLGRGTSAMDAAPPAGESTPASRLAEQNRLFQAAMSHKRRGDDRASMSSLDELLARHPDSPLAQEARVERMRALARLGDKTGAARDARRYLAEHGDGFAKDEAREVALEPTSAPSARAPAKKP